MATPDWWGRRQARVLLVLFFLHKFEIKFLLQQIWLISVVIILFSKALEKGKINHIYTNQIKFEDLE